MQLRVFGGSEAPGSYAVFLGVALTLCLTRVSTSRYVAARLGWLLLATALVVPLLLSGVRAVLVAIAAAAIVLIVAYARGISRILLVLAIIGIVVALNFLITTFGEASRIFSVDRYTDLAEDNSFGYRLDLYGVVLDPLGNIVGQPASTHADGLIPDLILHYGYVSGLLVAVFLVLILVRAFSRLRSAARETAPVVAILIVTWSFAGNVFLSAFGLVAAMAIGSALKRVTPDPPPSAADFIDDPPSLTRAVR